VVATEWGCKFGCCGGEQDGMRDTFSLGDLECHRFGNTPDMALDEIGCCWWCYE